MAEILKIPSKISNDLLEGLLLTLNNEEKSDIDLEIPKVITYRGFGIFTEILQVVFTWSRNKKGSLIIDIDEEDANALSLFAQSFFGYTILSYLWQHTEIINTRGSKLKQAFVQYTKQMHTKISVLDGLPNDEIVIPIFDHYSKEKGLSTWVYKLNYDFAEYPSELETSFYRLIDHLGKIYRTRLTVDIKDSFDDLLIILWELLLNTHEHARTDYLNRVTLIPNSRGLFMSIHKGTRESLIQSSSQRGLKDYYEHAFENNEQIFILEISVFDSGPGLVKRFLGEKWTSDININDEVDTVKKCLIKGRTSVSNYYGLLKGNGLDNVLRLLGKKNGFLKIRTNSTCLYRDMIQSPYTQETSVENVNLHDWVSSSPVSYTKMNSVQGSSITLAYPLKMPK